MLYRTAAKIPVILDTDIGGDIDDSWALAMLLKSPELDVRLIVSDSGDTDYRARIIARMLEIAGRTDIPVGMGLRQSSDGPRERLAQWVADYPLSRYPGKVCEDGVQAMIDTILSSPEPVTVIAIGPMPNLLEALRREPGIAQRANFVGMHGSIRKHHRTNMNNRGYAYGAIAEWNVVCDIPAAKAVFSAPWRSVTITPLDTCGFIQYDGSRYEQLKACPEPLLRSVIEQYRQWSPRNAESNPEAHTSVLFDTVAVYLAFSRENLLMQQMPLLIDDKGFTVEDPQGMPVDVAVEWTNVDRYYDFLCSRLQAPVVPAPVR